MSANLFEMFSPKLPQNRHPEFGVRVIFLSRDTALGGAESKDPGGPHLPNAAWSFFIAKSGGQDLPAVHT